ncbi:hypothetical protein J7J26_04095 [Candidatus Micrarchaeota archaeon]|nr:hypothetical protein [Candidatus Micrarchaeota archaeon]
MKKRTNDIYKHFGDIFGDLHSEDIEKFKDPVVLGILISRLIDERENTHRILKTLVERLDRIERKLSETETKNKEQILSEIDEDLYNFVKVMGKVCAADVKKHFRYKGKNAASARLNKLVNMNLLNKKQAGKKVFFYLR